MSADEVALLTNQFGRYAFAGIWVKNKSQLQPMVLLRVWTTPICQHMLTLVQPFYSGSDVNSITEDVLVAIL